MPIENISAPKAPADWKPTPDQQRRINSDPRLKSMGRDDLYSVFNKPKPKGDEFSGAFHERAKAAPASGGFLGGVYNRLSDALKGK